MVFTLNSFVGFTSTAKHQNVPRECIGLKASHFPSSSTSLVFSRRPIHTRNQRPLSVSNSDRVTTETTEKTSEIPEVSISINQSLPTSEADPIKKTQPDEAASNGSISSPSESEPKRSKLTAREKLKAARVRSRSSEPKPVKKAEMGSKVLEALRENDRISGKMRSGLPEAPTNLFDDSKRGMPKKGLTFELPVGWDVFLIILSVVLISTIMFTTTFIVWKVGAIHFNEN